jgi:hypothetical protein
MKKLIVAYSVLLGFFLWGATGLITNAVRFVQTSANPGSLATGQSDLRIDSDTGKMICVNENGTSCLPFDSSALDPTQITLIDEFCCGDTTSSVARAGNLGWFINVGVSGTVALTTQAGTGLTENNGIFRLTTTSTDGSRAALGLSTATSSSIFNTNSITSHEWSVIAIVRAAEKTDIRRRFGLMSSSSSPPPTSGMFFRYDTNASFNDDTKGGGAGRWVVQVCDGCTTDTSGSTAAMDVGPVDGVFQKLQISRVENGVNGNPTYYFQVDNGVVVTGCVSGCTFVPSIVTDTGWTFVYGVQNDAAAVKTADIDWFGFQMTGLTR